ncbi:cyclic AMP-dependent transcription factor ATF-3 [Bufo bufo]|uniref:cyclic AMP-dependent transcription factor ATF-3 n=1 Tax=Bufo bufo TaxID=8384 RepID=UPI001ABE3391|nr:cyclic AMP-dependent transcription factor ATF-3 [Bufo bufo]
MQPARERGTRIVRSTVAALTHTQLACAWPGLAGILHSAAGSHQSRKKMMLQHPGQGSASEVSASATLPCLSPTMTFAFEDFTNLTPLVKEELRFAIQSKRLATRPPCSLDSVVVADSPIEMTVTKTEFVPVEDERKQRRRERNKVAAAKCRNKKKEKTDCLQKESEKLESINAELKAQIEQLKNEKQHLIYMLNLHRPTCIVRAQNGRTPEDERNLFIQQIKEGALQNLVTEGVN